MLKPIIFLTVINTFGSFHWCFGMVLNYKWTASINDDTALANSLETSSSSSSKCCSMCQKTKIIQEQFSKYPQFLGRKKLSFGLLSVRQQKNNSSIEICVPLPFLNISLLTFGRPKTHSFSNNHMSEVITEIPILGGMLTCRCHDRENVDKNDNQSLGMLQFEYLQQQNKKSQIGKMKTRIVNYKPAIAGCAPLNRVRKLFYLSLQRPIHAYVMWRFHQDCQKSVCEPLQ